MFSFSVCFFLNWKEHPNNQTDYRKILKISPSMYKPLQNISPPRACTWKIAPKYKVKQKAKSVNLLPTIRLAHSILKRKFASVDKPLQI